MSWSLGEGGGLAGRVRGRRFSLAMRGYAAAEVDRFLADLAEGIERLELASSRPYGTDDRPRLDDAPTPEAIQKQVFTVALNGYAMIEVDAFLDDVTEAVASLWARLPTPPPAPPPALAAPPVSERPSRPSSAFTRLPAALPGTSLEVARPLPPQPAPSPTAGAVPARRGLPELPAPARGDQLDAATVRSVQFPKVLRGYARKQVDEFLRKAAETLDHLDAALEGATGLGRPVRPPGLMTPADVEAAAFYLALRGYAIGQVDDFLDRVAEAIAARDARFAGPA